MTGRTPMDDKYLADVERAAAAGAEPPRMAPNAASAPPFGKDHAG